MLLLDAKQRLVLVHARRDAGPRILRQHRRGDPHGFAEIALPEGLDRAGYIGSAMDGDRLVLGYIGRPGAYSFQTAWVDLDTGLWSGPFVLASGQALRLYRGEDRGRKWSTVALRSFEEFGLKNTFFLYGITPASGSLIPGQPCAVFSSGTLPNTELWFVRFETPGLRTR